MKLIDIEYFGITEDYEYKSLASIDEYNEGKYIYLVKFIEDKSALMIRDQFKIEIKNGLKSEDKNGWTLSRFSTFNYYGRVKIKMTIIDPLDRFIDIDSGGHSISNYKDHKINALVDLLINFELCTCFTSYLSKIKYFHISNKFQEFDVCGSKVNVFNCATETLKI